MADWRGNNDTTPNITVSIDGTDYSANLGNGFVESTFIDSDNPLGKFWSGQFTLTNDIARVVSGSLVAAVDLDPTSNTDFERSNLVLIVANGNTLRLRIESVSISAWSADITPTEIEVSVVDKLGLVNREFPANPVFVTNRSVSFFFRPEVEEDDDDEITLNYSTWLTAIESELTGPKNADGSPIITSADIDLVAPDTLPNGLPDGYSSSQNRDKNPYKNAAEIAAVRGYTLYCDPTDEVIRLTTYPITAPEAQVTRRLALSQLLLIVPSIQPLDEAVESVEVTTQSVQVLTPDERYPITTPLAVAYPPGSDSASAFGTDDPIVVCERIEQRPRKGGRTFQQNYAIRARSFWIFESTVTVNGNVTTIAPNTSTAWLTVCSGSIVRRFNSDGIATVNNDSQSIMRGVIIDNGMPKNVLTPLAPYYRSQTLDGGQGTREQITIDRNGLPTKRRKQFLGTLASRFSDLLSVNFTNAIAVRVLSIEEETTTEIPGGKYVQITGYTELSINIVNNVFSTSYGPSKGKQPGFRTIDGVPRPEGSEDPDSPVGVLSHTSSQSVNSPLGKGKTKSTTSTWGTSEAHAKASARLALALKQQGAISYDVERVLQPGESFVPFRCEHCGDRALILDAERLSWEPNNMRFSYTGRQIGTLAASVTIPRRVVPVPSVALVAGPMPDLI